MVFDGQEEKPVPFRSDIPQGSPLSPILFVIYAATLNPPGQQPRMEYSSSYVDDKIMIQGVKTHGAAAVFVQSHLDNRIQRAEHLNIRFAVNKAKLMHHLHHINPRPESLEGPGIMRYGSPVIHKTSMIRGTMDRPSPKLENPHCHGGSQDTKIGRLPLEHSTTERGHPRRNPPPSLDYDDTHHTLGIQSMVDRSPTHHRTTGSGIQHAHKNHQRTAEMDPPALLTA